MDWMGFSSDTTDEEALSLAEKRFGTNALELRRTRGVVLVRPKEEVMTEMYPSVEYCEQCDSDSDLGTQIQ